MGAIRPTILNMFFAVLVSSWFFFLKQLHKASILPFSILVFSFPFFSFFGKPSSVDSVN